MLQFRAVQERDWPKIVQLASNETQEADHSGLDHLWVEGRRSFEGVRCQAVVESAGSIVGFCSIERADDDVTNSYRVFLVTDWNCSGADVQEELFVRAEQMLLEVGATQAWMRELTGDRELLRFIEKRGFEASASYTMLGREMVNLTKRYAHDENTPAPPWS